MLDLKVLSLIGALAKTQGCKFASFTYTSKATGERAKIQVLLGVDIENVYRRDLATIADLLPTLTDPIEIQAATEIRDSLVESLEKGIGNNSAYAHGVNAGDTYATVENIPGVMVHKTTGEIYVKGMIQKKEVIVPGTHKVVKSAPKTLAKKKLDKDHLRRGDIRQYSLVNIGSARLNGDTLVFE